MEQKYIKSGQWHILASVDDQAWRARCGVDLSSSMDASTTLPVNEATCNTCLELDRADRDRAEGDTPGAAQPTEQ